MTWRRAVPWLLLFGSLAAAGGCGLWQDGLERGRHAVEVGRGASVPATVISVVDGDTIKVSLRGATETVRYIGIDTPETRRPGTPIECFGKAASAYNRRLVAGQAVTLRTDAEPRDRYGRLLAYVYRRRDGLWVNGALVAAGYATILTVPPNVARAAQLRGLERRARQAGAGLWTACP